MKTTNFILSGLGGQGILFMTRILATAALTRKYDILGAETHGMAQRGGSVVSHLKIGDAQASLIRAGAADYLIATDEIEAYRCLPFVRPGGLILTHSEAPVFPDPRVAAHLTENRIRACSLPAGRLARELGAPRSTNLAMVGFFAGFAREPLSADDLRAAVAAVSPERVRNINLEIFDRCYEQGKNHP